MYISPPQILEVCEKLVDLHAWPAAKLDVHGWMNNFHKDEKPLASHLLSVFMYFSESMVDALFRSAFHDVCNITQTSWKNRLVENRRWNTLIDNSIITIVEGEQPNATDSGFYFARKARQVLGIPDDQILSTNDAMRRLMQGHCGPVIFVDDFVGSGEQFLKTWNRAYQGATFSQISAQRPNQNFVYCNAIMTKRGYDRLRREASSVILSSGNVLPENYSCVVEDSLFWPNGEASRGIEFIREVSARAGIPDTDGGESDWRGFHKLGLALAFQHSTPDATLPIFYWEQNWAPLVRRS